MAFKFKTTVDEKGSTIHHGTCGHEYPGSGKRGRPFTECPKCRKAAGTTGAKRAAKSLV
jgi:hypothetical protein